MLQSPTKSAYLKDDWKWPCDKKCDGNKHSKGCQITRDALVKKYWKTRQRIILNRRKSRNAVEEAIEKVRFLISRWCHINERLELELGKYSDMLFIEGIDIGECPDEYDTLEQVYDNLEARVDALEATKKEIAYLTEKYKHISKESFENRKKVWDDNLHNKKEEAQAAFRDLQYELKRLDDFAPSEERSHPNMLQGVRERVEVRNVIDAQYGLSRNSNKNRYQVQVSYNQPQIPHTLRYLHTNNTYWAALQRLKEYDDTGSVKKVEGVVSLSRI